MSVIDAFARANLMQFESILRKALPDTKFPSNLVDLLWDAMKDNDSGRTVMSNGTFVKPTWAMLHGGVKKIAFPFMPDRIDYEISKGHCSMIVENHGMFTPCCKKCKDGKTHCDVHLAKPTPFGEYEDRLEQWADGENVGKLSYEIETDGKTKVINEVTFGEYLHEKGLTVDEVRQMVKDAHITLKFSPHDLEIRPKIKKSKGRPSAKKVKDSDDGEEITEEVEAEKPKKLSEEEKAIKKAEEERLKAEKKAQREAEKVIRDEKKAAEEIEKAKKRAEKLEKQLADAKEKADKPKKKLPPPPRKQIGTSLDCLDPVDAELTKELYEGDLSTLDEFEADGITYYSDEDRNVYNADRKKVGVIDEDGDLVLN
jgi:hypothetical protein